jgi:hypothetical protein
MSTPSQEDRLQAIEDRLAIYTLIASHPPSADTGSSSACGPTDRHEVPETQETALAHARKLR